VFVAGGDDSGEPGGVDIADDGVESGVRRELVIGSLKIPRGESCEGSFVFGEGRKKKARFNAEGAKLSQRARRVGRQEDVTGEEKPKTSAAKAAFVTSLERHGLSRALTRKTQEAEKTAPWKAQGAAPKTKKENPNRRTRRVGRQDAEVEILRRVRVALPAYANKRDSG
jgi:hypothetical protein